jgi:hypothetical protein
MSAFLSFFDDDYEPDEAPPSRSARKRPSLPGTPKGKGPQRLLVLVIGVLIVLVAGYFLVQRCQRDREVTSYQSYVSKSNEVASRSSRSPGTRPISTRPTGCPPTSRSSCRRCSTA